MRKHPEVGYRHPQAIPFLTAGGGDRALAPGALRRQRLSAAASTARRSTIGARIFAIADTLDAMTSDRPYRKGVSFAEARLEIARCAGTQFDPACAGAFEKLSDEELQALRCS